MRKRFLSTLMLVIAATLFSCDGNKTPEPTAQSGERIANAPPNSNDIVYSDSDFVIMRRPNRIKEITNREITDGQAETFINSYRQEIDDQATRYQSHNFNRFLHTFLKQYGMISFKNGDQVIHDSVGIRLYLGKNANSQLNIMLGITYNGKALWNNATAASLGLNNPDEFQLFDDGSLCPPGIGCGSDDNLNSGTNRKK